jgi:hypothetical protein
MYFFMFIQFVHYVLHKQKMGHNIDYCGVELFDKNKIYCNKWIYFVDWSCPCPAIILYACIIPGNRAFSD